MGYGKAAASSPTKTSPWELAILEIAKKNVLLAERLGSIDYDSLWLNSPEKISPAVYLALARIGLFDINRGTFTET